MQKIITFKEYLIERANEYEPFENEDKFFDFHESMNEIKYDLEQDVIHQMIDATPNDTITWSVIPAGRLKKIWGDYGKLGIIRDSKGLEKIRDIIIANTLKLNLTNALCGHDKYDPIKDEFQDKYELTEEQLIKINKVREDYDDYYNFFRYNNQDLISDYGLPQLLEHLPELYQAKTDEEILRASDKMLNVVHPRNDLAGFFVEGGSNTLSEVSGE